MFAVCILKHCDLYRSYFFSSSVIVRDVDGGDTITEKVLIMTSVITAAAMLKSLCLLKSACYPSVCSGNFYLLQFDLQLCFPIRLKISDI